jgi:hypothetical protein
MPRVADLVLLVALCAPSAGAQRVLGFGDDAVPVPRGAVRVGVRAGFANWDDVFLDGRRVAAGTPFTRDSILARDLAALGAASAPLATLTGGSFAVSLGSLGVDQRARRVTVPFGVELGATSRLTVALRGTFVTAESEQAIAINADVAAATFGLNPALTSSAAQAQNATLLTQLQQAGAALDQRIAFCAANPAAAGCATVNAESAQARGVVADADAWRTAAAALYRDGRFAPRTGSAAHGAAIARLDALRTGFTRYGVTALSATAAPAAASPLGATDFDRLLTDERFGLRYRAARRSYAQGYGSAELAARYVLLDAIDTTRPRGARVAVGGAYRTAPFGADDPDDLFDIPRGETADSWRAELIADVRLRRVVWATVSATHQRFATAVEPGRRRLEAIELFAARDTASLERAAGAVTTVAITPRWEFGRSFALGAGYSLVHRADDVERFRSTTAGSDVATGRLTRIGAGGGATTAHAWSVGFAYSTLGSWLERRARLPVDVSWSRSAVWAGGGGVVDAAVADVVALRVYYRR